MSLSEYRTQMPAPSAPGGNLADILERVLDKGVVIAGDISINLLDIELLTIKLRLLIASADTAQKMGIDWWKNDPFLTGEKQVGSGSGNGQGELGAGNGALDERLDRIERAIASLSQEKR